MIFRNDDLGYSTKIEDFKEAHSLFQKYGVKHTIAVIYREIEKNAELIKYINENKKEFDIAIHCLDHYDFTENHDILEMDLRKAMKIHKALFGEDAKDIYAPWNKSDSVVEKIVSSLKLKLNTEKVSLTQYIKSGGFVKQEVINFHSWHFGDLILIEPALKIYTKKKNLNVCE